MKNTVLYHVLPEMQKKSVCLSNVSDEEGVFLPDSEQNPDKPVIHIKYK